jgi:hypothetical protein
MLKLPILINILIGIGFSSLKKINVDNNNLELAYDILNN